MTTGQPSSGIGGSGITPAPTAPLPAVVPPQIKGALSKAARMRNAWAQILSTTNGGTSTSLFTNSSITSNSIAWGPTSSSTPVPTLHATVTGIANATVKTSVYSTSPSGRLSTRPPKWLGLEVGDTLTLELPDGSILKVDKLGNYKINDKDAKVTYSANRVREFNKYLNASDLMEGFIKYVKTLDVTQSEFFDLPIDLFIKWLVIEAARADGEDFKIDQQLLEESFQSKRKIIRRKCLDCGRFISHKLHKIGVNFCDSAHMDRYIRKFNGEETKVLLSPPTPQPI